MVRSVADRIFTLWVFELAVPDGLAGKDLRVDIKADALAVREGRL